MKEIYFVTHNVHKFNEVESIAKEYDISLLWFNIEYEEIQDDDLDKIAHKSCINLLKENPDLKQKEFFIEDAGLFIQVLKGFPGPYSAYVFQTISNEGILDLLKNKTNKLAYFKSVVAFYSNNKIVCHTGKTDGHIVSKIMGEEGFGFDPIFRPTGAEETFAQMSLTTKNLYSHRQKSVREMFTSITAFEKTTSGE